MIQRKIDSLPLVSKSTLLELGTLKETNELRINCMKTILSDYSDIFQGISGFREKNTRRLKSSWKWKLKQNLWLRNQTLCCITSRNHSQGVEDKIFKKVPDGEAITWWFNRNQKSHTIRARTDTRIPNHEAKPVRSITKSRRLHLASTRRQDLYETGHQTRLPPISSKTTLTLNKTNSNVQHTLA